MSSESLNNEEKQSMSSDPTGTSTPQKSSTEFVNVKEEIFTEYVEVSVKVEPKDYSTDPVTPETEESIPSFNLTAFVVKAEPLDYSKDNVSDSKSDEESLKDKIPVNIKINENYCTLCDKSFTTKGSLLRHYETHNRQYYTCEICLRPYSDPKKLATHIEEHATFKEFKCDQCGKVFKSSSLLHRHERSHLIVRPFECDLCGKTFSFKANLDKHRGKVRCKIPSIIKCNICDKIFKTNYLLKSHLRRHATGKPFTCDLCQTNFKHKVTLIRHMQLHTGMKPYTCTFCGKGFTHHALLKPHLRTHTGEKPYQCPVCNKDFTYKHNMQRHAQRHEKVKHLTCEVCNKSFPKESRLKYHMKIHINEKHFPCSVCPKKFSHRQNIMRHYKRKHPNVPYDCKETDASVALKVWDEVVNLKTKKLDRLPEKVSIPIVNAEVINNEIDKKDDDSEYIVPDKVTTVVDVPVVVKIETDIKLEN